MINGGGWLRVGDRRVDWLCGDLDRVSRTLDDCRAGRTTCDYQPGHPHGFHNHIYAEKRELFRARPREVRRDHPRRLGRAATRSG